MVKDLTFDVSYYNELAHDYFGDGKKLADELRQIYHDKGLEFPDSFESTLTVPPIHFMDVMAPDDVDVNDLRHIEVPPGLKVDILDFHVQ